MISQTISEQLQLLAYVILILRIRQNQSCQGISYQSFEIILIVYLARYWDIFYHSHTFYNIIMKLLYILSIIYIIYLMKYKYKQSLNLQYGDDEERKSLNFKSPYILAGLLATIINTNYFHIIEMSFEQSWSYSKWLEAMSIIPQIQYLQQNSSNGNIDGIYLSVLCLKRLFYHISGIQIYYYNQYICYTSALAGILQTILFGFLIKQYSDNKLQQSIHV